MPKLMLNPEDFLQPADFANIANALHGHIVYDSKGALVIQTGNSAGECIQLGFVAGETIMSSVIESALK